MHKNNLVRAIQEHLNKPQRSERWAMYRLIAPVIDFANSTMGLEAYFEFNQTSAHGTNQSVDIALLYGLVPRVMVEAKRVDRRVAGEQISKYLRQDVRGIVTNGVHWVMCLNGESKAVSLRTAFDGQVAAESLNEIIAFIRGEELVKSGWSTDQKYIDSIVKPEKQRKEERARRVSNAVAVAVDTDAIRRAGADDSGASVFDKAFLRALSIQFEEHGGVPEHLRCEVRASRVVFFDTRTNGKRVARIELGRLQSDVLVLTELVASTPDLSQIASATPHDKGPHMRRFRLSGESQALEFGKALARALSV